MLRSTSPTAGHSPGRTVGETLLRLLGIGATLEQATDRYQQAAFGAMASGTYFAWGKVTKLPQQAQDAGVRQALWRLLEKLTSDRAPASVEMLPAK